MNDGSLGAILKRDYLVGGGVDLYHRDGAVRVVNRLKHCLLFCVLKHV